MRGVMPLCHGLNPDEFPGVPNHGEQEDNSWPQVYACEVFAVPGRKPWPLCAICFWHLRQKLLTFAHEALNQKN